MKNTSHQINIFLHTSSVPTTSIHKGNIMNKNIDAEKLGMLARLIYNLFFRKKLTKAAANSNNAITYTALDMVNRLADGE
jgi:hypothetical protein